MPSSASSLLVLILLAARGHAACPQSYEAIREEAYRLHRVELSCEEVRRAARALPIRGRDTAQDTVAFAAELDLRQRLADEKGVRVPQEILLLGFIERQPPAGPRILVAFGQDMPKRMAGFLRLAELEEAPARESAAAVLGEGVVYDKVGFYFEGADGKLPSDGVWRDMKRGGLWGVHQPALSDGMRLCAACEGWLCPKAKLACFSDLNDDGAEEVHLTDDCPSGTCGVAALEPHPEGALRLILSQTWSDGARWKRTKAGWAVMREPVCRGGRFRCGEGRVRCERPQLFLLSKGAGAVARSFALEDAAFPVRRIPWPKRCPARKGDVELVYEEADGFTLYER